MSDTKDQLKLQSGTASSQDESLAQNVPEKGDSEKAPQDQLPRPLWRLVIVMICLAAVVFCAAIDQAIVAPALPTIGARFGNGEQTSWVGTAYLLSYAAMSVFYGNLAVIFGTKVAIFVALIIHAIGDAICGAAQSMIMLIIGRAIAGIGGGGLISTSLMAILFLVPARHLPRFQGLLGSVFAISAVGGPVLGGVFTTQASWRWCFFFKLPIAAAAGLGIFLFLHLPPSPSPPSAAGMTKLQRVKRLDAFGALLVFGAVLCILVPIQLGGETWKWDAPQTIVMLVIGGLALLAFIWRCATTTRDPVIPMQLFKNRQASGLLMITFCVGFIFYTMEYYVPQYFQTVDGSTAQHAGIRTIPLALSVVFCTATTGFLIPYTGYAYLPFLGSMFGCIGLGLMSTLNAQSADWKNIVFLIFVGFGTGLVVQTCIIGIQQSVSPELVQVATSTNTFIQVMGGTLGVAMAGSIFNNRLASCLREHNTSFSAGNLRDNPSIIRTLPSAQQVVVQDCYASSISRVWIALIPFAALMSVAMTVTLLVRRLDKKKAAALTV